MFVNCLNMTENIVLFSPLHKPKLDFSHDSQSSLGILPDNVGESLRFLNNSKLCNLNTRAIDILPPDEDLFDGRDLNESDIFNTAFLQTSRRNTSSHSSVSSSSDEYENIRSSSGSISSILNTGFITPKLECRRTRSLPEYCKNDSRMDLNDADNEDDQFQDSVFIEEKYITPKIADGSILNDSFNNEMGNLDNIPPPLRNEFAEPEQIFDVENSPITNNCENISIKNSSITKIPSITVSVTDSNLRKKNLSNKSNQRLYTDSTSRKGPVKAVVPVNVMKKKEIKLEIPGKTNNSIKKPVQYKKTSTPLNTPRLIPVAVSTRTLRQNGDVSSAIPKSVRDWQSPQHKSPAVLNNRRPLPSSKSFTNRPVEHKRSTSTSKTSFSQMHHKVKREQPTESNSSKGEGRRRSKSLGSIKPMGLMSSLNRVGEKLLNLNNLLLKYKKLGKENLKK